MRNQRTKNNTVWIWNHYATDAVVQHGGRHYYFAKYLKEAGYDPIIFCASTIHNSSEKIDVKGICKGVVVDGIKVVYVKAREYHGNGKQRILNMIDFYWNVKRAVLYFVKKRGLPEVIYASSVHPLTLVAGIQIGRKIDVPCVCEVRDLWPESIVAYSDKWERNSPLMRILYAGEKWIYKRADHLIMTWPGGYDYIKDQGWSNEIPKSKITHISNGVDLELFEENCGMHVTDDSDLDTGFKNFIYTGSIRKVNNLNLLVDTAIILREKKIDDVKILVYGDGEELERLRNKAKKNGLNNIVFKGRIEKRCIPYILRKSYATILHNSSTILDKYGQSQNKFFEYLAAGKPILMTYSVGHSIIKARKCGIELEKQTPEYIAGAIERLTNLNADQYAEYCNNAELCSKEYDFKNLTHKLIDIIENEE